jgi:hypothetical protein
MTDTRLPSRWLLDPTYNALSDGAWRTFTRLLMWSVDARTDGVIQLDQLDLIPRARAEHVPELTAAGVADVRAGVLTLTCFTSTQTSREQLEAAEAAREAERAADRERKRRDRLHKKGDHSLCDHGDDPAESKSGRRSDRNPAPETQEGRKAGRQALTEPPTDRRNDADDRPPRVTLPGSVLGPQAADEPSNDLGFAAGRIDLESSWPPTLCTTTGHHGCGWQTRADCRDCRRVAA